jgi:hypothetical protein
MSDLSVALDAMLSDAGVWDRAGGDLDGPRNAAGSLGLSAADVSMYGSDAGIDTTYQDAQTTLENMLGQASQNFHKLATTLRNAATLYEQQEAVGAAQVKGAGH